VNRQTKRLMQRQGQIDRDGEPVRSQAPPRTAPRPAKDRVGPREYVRQVRGELRKVAWPTRAEVVRFSVIVFIALVILTLLIFGLDLVFGKAVIWLFE